MRKFAATYGLALAVTGMTMSGAFAQDGSGCTCILPPGAPGQTIGAVESVKGNVQISQAVGFSSASAGTQVTRGARIIVGSDSEAVLDLGANCRRTIQANQDVEIDPLNDNICVKIIDSTTGEMAGGGGNVVAGVAAVAGVGGVVALIANSVSD